MSSTTLYRWSGIVLLVGSLLGVIASILDSVLNPSHDLTAQQFLSTPFTIIASLFLVWSLLLAMSLPGFYLRQAARAGALGFVGFVLFWLALLLGCVAFASAQVIDWPYLAQYAPKLLPSGATGPVLGGLLWIFGPTLLFGVGSILLGIATMRAHVFPRWIGILLLISGVLFLLSFPLTASLFGEIIDLASNLTFFVAFAWCGYTLIARGKEPVAVTFAPAGAQVSR